MRWQKCFVLTADVLLGISTVAGEVEASTPEAKTN